MDWRRVKADFKYIFLNGFAIYIPSWTIRKAILKIMGMDLGRGSRIGLGTKIIQPETIHIGNRSIINEWCHLDGRGGLFIGDDVSISVYSKFVTASHKINSATFEYFEDATKVEERVWLGIGAIILNGSVLGRGSVIGAGCVFKGKAEPYKIYVGNPAKEIKERNRELRYQFDYRPYFR